MFASTFEAHLERYFIQADPEAAAEYAAKNSLPPSSTTNPSIRSRHAKTASAHQSSYHYDPQRLDKMYDMLRKYEENFARHLKILLDTLNYLAATETVVFLSLCARLKSAGEGGIVGDVEVWGQ
jgi:gamma-tubulin complex component 2